MHIICLYHYKSNFFSCCMGFFLYSASFSTHLYSVVYVYKHYTSSRAWYPVSFLHLCILYIHYFLAAMRLYTSYISVMQLVLYFERVSLVVSRGNSSLNLLYILTLVIMFSEQLPCILLIRSSVNRSCRLLWRSLPCI